MQSAPALPREIPLAFIYVELSVRSVFLLCHGEELFYMMAFAGLRGQGLAGKSLITIPSFLAQANLAVLAPGDTLHALTSGLLIVPMGSRMLFVPLAQTNPSAATRSKR